MILTTWRCPPELDRDRQRNFIDGEDSNDAADHTPRVACCEIVATAPVPSASWPAATRTA